MAKVQQTQSQSEKTLIKYNTLKQKWNKRVTHIINKKNSLIKEISTQHKEDKKKLIQSFEEEKQKKRQLKNQKEIQKITQEMEQSLKQKEEEVFRKCETLKQTNVEQQQKHIQKNTRVNL